MSFFPRDAAAPADTTVPAIEWEEVSCLLCGGRHWSHLVEAPDNIGAAGLWFAVVQCQECGLCFTNPRPSPYSIASFYPAAYWPQRAPAPSESRAGKSRRVSTWYPRLRERKTLQRHGQGRLLDFGCGGGSYLERMHRQGWRVVGIDPSAAAVNRIRMELGLKAFAGTLPHPELAPGSFDVITMWHSLEHVHQPREVLRQAYFLLAPGGRLLVAVPNIESLPFRWFGRSWYGLDLPRHLTHFSPRTLRLMLERVGFVIRQARMVRQTNWMRYSAGLACQATNTPRWQKWLRARSGSRLACWYSLLWRQADCMLVTAERAD
jgi:2-polyprenyl-3-methyl-5-hydroxy-6-metoxy-1,4-benzoquinol methylase